MIWLIPVFVVCAVGSWVTYCRREEDWAPWLMAGLAATCGAMWVMAVRRLGQEQVFAFGLAYDAVVMAAYYLLPLAMFGTKPTTGLLVGAGLVVTGLVVVKISG